MEQLHPKAKWLFFFQFIWAGIVPGFIILFILGVFILQEAVKYIGIAGLLFILIAILLGVGLAIATGFFWAILTYKNYKYEVAEDALKIERGVIWKKYVSIPYERIQNVDIYRGLLARLLRLSDLQIQTAGYSASYTGYGMFGGRSEGRLPGLDPQKAEQLRDELIRRVKGAGFEL